MVMRHCIGTIDDFPQGVPRSIEVDGKSFLVVRLDDGTFAIDGRCSHMGMDLSKGRLDDHTVECRLHHAVFDLRTGKVLRNLAARDLSTYDVTIEDGQVYLDI
jgi:3-phenylpropionate/trans-cinnamate dioxygenase ferredoxin subunit